MVGLKWALCTAASCLPLHALTTAAHLPTFIAVKQASYQPANHCPPNRTNCRLLDLGAAPTYRGDPMYRLLYRYDSAVRPPTDTLELLQE